MSELTWIPAVLVVLPIVAAAFPLALGRLRSGIGWWVMVAGSALEFALAVVLALAVIDSGPVRHALGGFERPIGIELVADELSVLVVVVIAATALAVAVYTRGAGPRGAPFASVFLLLIGGLMGVTLTGDMFNLFVFLEITGIATYALIAARDRPPAALAALKYLVIGTVGATLYLIGVGYLYASTGTLNMADLAASLAGGGSADLGVMYDDTLVKAGFAFVFAGLATKVAIFPVHSWQPDAYAEAPDAVTTLISALVSTVGAYALIRVTFSVFTVDFFAAVPEATWMIVAAGTVSIVVGSTLAVVQSRIKRMLAYSSVAQFGLVVAAIGIATSSAATQIALVGAIVHLLGHAIMKGGLFATAGALAQSTGARTVTEYADIGRRRPVSAAAVGVLGLALVGVPPSVGFVGKWYIAVGAVEAGIWIVAVVIFASTLLTLGYVARLLERMYFVPGERAHPVATDGGRSVGLAVVAVGVGAAIVAVSLGFTGELLFEILEPYTAEVLDP